MVAAARNEIERAAIVRLGAVGASVKRYEVRPSNSASYKPDPAAIDDGGVWFMLFIKQSDGSPWQAVGRRRTRSQLTAAIENYRLRQTLSGESL